MDYLAIRQRSVRELARWKLADPGVLPLHCDEDFDRVRDATTMAARCHATGAALAPRQGAPPEHLHLALEDNDLERWLAARELRLLRHLERDLTMDAGELRETSVDVSWREEAVWALMWSIQLVDQLPPEKLCDRDLDPSQGRSAPAVVLERRRALEWPFQDVPSEDVDLGA